MIPSRAAAGNITIESFSAEPLELRTGESFRIRATVSASGVNVVSFVLRTAEPAARKDVPPFFTQYEANRQLAYLTQDGGVNLSDNGPLDLDGAANAFAIDVSTKDWQPGRYVLAFFAHNRPGSGGHIFDQRNLVVTVNAGADGAPGAVEVAYVDPAKAPSFALCAIEPAVVSPGEPVVFRIETDTEGLSGAYISHQYRLPPDRVPPGLSYDEEDHEAYVTDSEEDTERLVADDGPNDRNPAPGKLAIQWDTTGWQPGLYHFSVWLRGEEGLKSPERNAAFKVRSPEDALDVTVSPSRRVCAGTHAERVTRLADGTLLYTSLISTDNGMTWAKREDGRTIGAGAQQLRSGRVLGMGYRTKPIEGRPGWYRGDRFVSEDGGRSVTGPLDAEFHVPQAKPAMGHAFHPGPLFMRSIVERPDGSLVALMAGWFKGDDAPCPHNPERPYSRTYTCESTDGGETWTYLSTIGYDHIGSEGYNEGSMKPLPDGTLMAVLRTGSMSDPRCQDNPIMVSTSADGGRTWTEPRRTGVHGAFPDLTVLSDGTLAITYGRPGASIVFSRDGGVTWTDRTVIDATRYSGYTTACETGPGELVVIFGIRDYFDVETGEFRNDVRAATVRYAPKGTGAHAAARAALEQAGVSVTEVGEGFLGCEMEAPPLGRCERFVVHLPAGYVQDGAPLPLLVFLHGLGRDHRTLIDVERTRAALARAPFVVVLPNGRASWWVDSPVDAGSQYESYLSDLIALVDKALNVSDEPGRRAIGGWSMGGFGSAHYLIAHPEQFGVWGGILALVDFPNAAYPPEQNHSVPELLGNQPDAFNPMRDIEAFRGKTVWFVTGDESFDCAMNRAFAARLEALGIPHEFSVVP
ncbi:MAG: exo-alpha-sialidase, partial [Candidatus Hydrogenedentes bacterium]|nr:exo-alpha-sialidase [Candidatus Hydrogenedentota bacterium]